MVKALIVAEHDHETLNSSTAKCVSFASTFAADGIDIAVLSDGHAGLADQAAQIRGVDQVLSIDSDANADTLAAVWAPQIVALAEGYSHILGPSSTFGKDLMPRIAGLLGVGQLSDVMVADGPHRFQRPIYAGNAIVTVECSPEKKLVATVRTASFSAAESGDEAQIQRLTLDVDLPAHTRFVRLDKGRETGPDLQTAARVVAGGRGLGSAASFELVRRLAAALGAATGASRAAVDAGFVPNDLQVGQTGKIIAPELYIAVGISGAIQHITGIKDARTIVAINKDAEAPIFEVADIGLVADLFAAVPELIDALEARALT
jgi:electron transfer flavoprotein alpha subunit